MTTIQAKRLLKLAKFLREKVAPCQGLYDQGIYVGPDKNDHWHEKASIRCGTPACALGWATAIFPLMLTPWPWHDIVIVKAYKKNKAAGRLPKIGRREGLDTGTTIEKFFGLTSNDEQYEVFFTTTHRTAEEEARVIERVVRVHHPELV